MEDAERKKQLLWEERNDILTHEGLIEKLFNSEDIKCQIICTGDIVFSYLLKHYRIEAHPEEMGFKLLEENLMDNKKGKFRHHEKRCFYADTLLSLIKSIIIYVKNINSIKLAK